VAPMTLLIDHQESKKARTRCPALNYFAPL
jgi:hypothetical protein